MKKLIIGRNNACDIIIPDTSDIVSRKQAVLAFSFWGKMVLYDTSNNGTYVNGQKLENGKGIRLTRKDKVNFARMADLNWSEVKNPYRKTWLYSAVFAIILIISTIILIFWGSLSDNGRNSTPAVKETPTQAGGTFTTIEPQPVKEQPKQQPSKKSKGKGKKKESVPPNNVINKEVNENSPIVY